MKNKNKKMLIILPISALVSALFIAIAGVAFRVESSFGPVNIGNYSISGPRNWTVFPGKAKIVLNCGRYKIWKRDGSQVIDGT